MKVIIDTQVFLWSVLKKKKIKPEIQDLLNTADVFLSSVSIYEIQLNSALGGSEVVPDFDFFFDNDYLHDLPFTGKHAQKTFDIPFKYRSPFGRMLIAQSMVENIPLLTSDKQIQEYDFAYIPI